MPIATLDQSKRSRLLYLGAAHISNRLLVFYLISKQEHYCFLYRGKTGKSTKYPRGHGVGSSPTFPPLKVSSAKKLPHPVVYPFQDSSLKTLKTIPCLAAHTRGSSPHPASWGFLQVARQLLGNFRATFCILSKF